MEVVTFDALPLDVIQYVALFGCAREMYFLCKRLCNRRMFALACNQYSSVTIIPDYQLGTVVIYVSKKITGGPNDIVLKLTANPLLSPFRDFASPVPHAYMICEVEGAHSFAIYYTNTMCRFRITTMDFRVPLLYKETCFKVSKYLFAQKVASLIF